MSMVCFLLLVTGIQAVSASEITVQSVLRLTNEARLSEGLSVLTISDVLSKAAESKAQDMMDKGYFSHDAPDGKKPWYWVEREGYKYRFAGENLAIHFSSVEDMHQAWLSSETHRKNILSPSYREIGIAVKSGSWEGKQTMIVVQFFGTTVEEEALVPGGIKELDVKSTAASSAASLTTGSRHLSILERLAELRAKVLGAMTKALGIESTDPIILFLAIFLGILFGVNTFAVIFIYIDTRKKKLHPTTLGHA